MPNAYKWINLSYLESIAEGDRDIIHQLVTIFLDQIPEFTEGFDKNFSEKNWRQIAAIAHKAKSSVLSMGMEDLGNQDLKNLELIAKQKWIEEIRAQENLTPSEKSEIELQEKFLNSFPPKRQKWILDNTSEVTISELIRKFKEICTAASMELQSELEK